MVQAGMRNKEAQVLPAGRGSPGHDPGPINTASDRYLLVTGYRRIGPASSAWQTSKTIRELTFAMAAKACDTDCVLTEPSVSVEMPW